MLKGSMHRVYFSEGLCSNLIPNPSLYPGLATSGTDWRDMGQTGSSIEETWYRQEVVGWTWYRPEMATESNQIEPLPSELLLNVVWLPGAAVLKTVNPLPPSFCFASHSSEWGVI